MNPLEDEERLSRRGFLAGTAGAAAAAGASGTALAQDGGNESDGGGDGGGEPVEIVVGPGGSPEFDPAEITITPGTTVVWTWDSDNHNVNPQEQPEDAEWEGHQDLENSGFEYEHTFEVTGEYHYVCDPHEGQGMVGDIIVEEGAGGGGGGEAGPPQQLVPDAAWTLIIATVAGMVSTLSLAYVFMRYGGPTGE